ncbi:hypothetical protein EMCRGX_G008764 [Ephydatia muelleri]
MTGQICTAVGYEFIKLTHLIRHAVGHHRGESFLWREMALLDCPPPLRAPEMVTLAQQRMHLCRFVEPVFCYAKIRIVPSMTVEPGQVIRSSRSNVTASIPASRQKRGN